MSHTSDSDLKIVNLGNPILRVWLILPIVAVLVASWFAVRWYIGDTIADYSPDLQGGGIDIAHSAMNLAPSDPLTHWSVASILKNSLEQGQISESLRNFEAAVSLSPHDYRYWVDLGRARSEMGDYLGAEKAMRQALALAPNYSYPKWYFGNLLLREGNNEEAFAVLREAADADPSLRPQIFNLATHVYGDDIDKIKNVLGGGPEAREQLVAYLISRNRIADATHVWTSMSPQEKTQSKDAGTSLLNALIAARQFKAALDVYRETQTAESSEAQPGKLMNPSFERDVAEAGKAPFGWQIKSTPPQTQVALDTINKHEGSRSLRVVFKSSSQTPFNNIYQLVVIQPSSSYRLSFWVKTEDLKSIGNPDFEVTDGATGTVLAQTGALKGGTNDWALIDLDFKTAANTEAVILRTNRVPCGPEITVCPIFGVVWYDDFTLQRIG